MATKGTHAVLPATTVEEFKTRLRGDLFCPGDDGYDSARKIHNGMIDKYPAMIVRCAGVADVIAAVNLVSALTPNVGCGL